MNEYYEGEQEDHKFGMALGLAVTLHADDAHKARMQLRRVREDIEVTLNNERNTLRHINESGLKASNYIIEGRIEAFEYVLERIDALEGEEE